MENWNPGRSLIGIGVLLVLMGLVFIAWGKFPWLGRLPGDIVIKRENFQFYFPLVTCLLISLIVTVLLRLIGRK